MNEEKSPFALFLEEKYREWSIAQIKGGNRRVSVSAFSEKLGIHPATFSNWINGNRTPGEDSIVLLAIELGPEIYDSLGMERPDPLLAAFETIYGQLTDRQKLALYEQAAQYITANQQTTNHQAETKTKLTTTKAELAETRRQLTNVTHAIAATGHSPALLKTLTELEKQETAIEQTLQTLTENLTHIPPQLDQARLNETTRRLKQQLESGNQALIRRTLQGLISRITVERDGKTILGLIQFYHPAQKKSPSKRGDLTTLRDPAGASPHSQTFSIPFEAILKYKTKTRPK